MVQNHNGLTHTNQIRTFRNGRLVYIHDNQNRILSGTCDFHCLLTAYNHVLIIRITLKNIHQRSDCAGTVIQYNVYLTIQRFGNSVNTYRRAETVHIRHTMPHDKNRILCGDDFTQCQSFYTGLYAGIFLYLLALTAIVGNTFRCLDNCLVTTTTQRKINGISCELIVLCIAKSVQTNTDTNGHRHLITDINRLNLFQKVKSGFLKLCDCLLPENNEILVLLQLFADAIQTGNILIDLSVNQCGQKGTAYLFYAFQGLLIIVQINHSGRKALIVHFL